MTAYLLTVLLLILQQ